LSISLSRWDFAWSRPQLTSPDCIVFLSGSVLWQNGVPNQDGTHEQTGFTATMRKGSKASPRSISLLQVGRTTNTTCANIPLLVCVNSTELASTRVRDLCIESLLECLRDHVTTVADWSKPIARFRCRFGGKKRISVDDSGRQSKQEEPDIVLF
jgi:hypothetical protein